MAGRSRRIAPAIGISLATLALAVMAFGSSLGTLDRDRDRNVEVTIAGDGCPPDGSVVLVDAGDRVGSATADAFGAYEFTIERPEPRLEVSCGDRVFRVSATASATAGAGDLSLSMAVLVPVGMLGAVVVIVVRRRRRLVEQAERAAQQESWDR